MRISAVLMLATLSMLVPGEADAQAPAPSAPVAAAYAFLDRQMDLYRHATVVYGEPAFSAYYPTGLMGDVDDVTIDADWRQQPHSGRASIRFDYRPRSDDSSHWVGLYFQYPDRNWGQFPGRNLTGAAHLSFWARADHDIVVEFFVGGVHDPALPYRDSIGKISTGPIVVTPRWERHVIPLNGQDLRSVIGAFGWTMQAGFDNAPRTLFLDDIEFDLPGADAPRFIQSYLPGRCEIGGSTGIAHTYDQALALLAFLVRGGADDLHRAELLARALVTAQQRDRTFHDGRLRNAYTSGELIDPQSGAVRMAGFFDKASHRYVEDEYGAGSDTGNLAWAALALVQAQQRLPAAPGDPYRKAAAAIARWIVDNTRMNDALGGFSAGVSGFETRQGVATGQVRLGYRATEHNIDLVPLFLHLSAAAGPQSEEGRFWQEQADHARMFVDAMRDRNLGRLATGTLTGMTVNTQIVPLDIQVWSVLALRGAPDTSLTWALDNCRSGEAGGFDFRCANAAGAWWEGTGQVATALKWSGRENLAAPIVTRLEQAQLAQGPAAGGIPAASVCGLMTGYDRVLLTSNQVVLGSYPDWPHVGATAWFLFAEAGANPYFIGG